MYATNMRNMDDISKPSEPKSFQSQSFKIIATTFDKYACQLSGIISSNFRRRCLEETEKMRTFAAIISIKNGEKPNHFVLSPQTENFQTSI